MSNFQVRSYPGVNKVGSTDSKTVMTAQAPPNIQPSPYEDNGQTFS